MLVANSSTPLWLCVAPVVLSGLLALETGCSGGGGGKKDAAGGATSTGIGGAHPGGTQAGGTQSSAGSSTNSFGGASNKATGGSANTTGGTSNKATGGASTNATGGTSSKATGGATTNASGGNACIPASTDLPAVHPTDEGTQACSSCHGTAIAGGFVFDGSGSAPVSGVTITLKPSNGSPKTAITGSKGMFRFSGDIAAPFEACLSRCPDTACSTLTDHQNAGDCGTCHGVTAPKLHLP